MVHSILLTVGKVLNTCQVYVMNLAVCCLALYKQSFSLIQVTVPAECCSRIQIALDILGTIGIDAVGGVIRESVGHQIVQEIHVRFKPPVCAKFAP